MQPAVQEIVNRSPLGTRLGAGRVFTSIDTAVTRFRTQYGAGAGVAPGVSHA